ncbi:hypothetical protein [Actinomadura sp. GTD37]|uniref:hypothetical protein n=1 Tax=Actinomadura sp. GTD37 TaxID=1778030 RepID=UPI0035BF494A
MEDRMDAAPSAPEQPITFERAGLSALGGPVAADEPSAAAVPLLRLTPVPELAVAREPWAGAVRAVVTGATVLVISVELGRRAGAPARLTAFCSAGACAVVVGPWLASQLVPQFAAQPAARPVARAVPQFASTRVG